MTARRRRSSEQFRVIVRSEERRERRDLYSGEWLGDWEFPPFWTNLIRNSANGTKGSEAALALLQCFM